MKKMTICFLLFVVMTAYLSGIETNWPNWRGPHHNRSVESGEYPVQWDSFDLVPFPFLDKRYNLYCDIS